MYNTLIKNLLNHYRSIFRIKLCSNTYSKEIKKTFDNEKLVKKYQQEIKIYIDEIKKEINIYKYLLLKSDDYYVNDTNIIIEKMKNHQKDRLNYIYNLHNNIDEALNLGLENKFYFPREKYSLYTDDDINNFYDILKGLSIDNVIEFLEIEGIFTKDRTKEIFDKAKILPHNIDSSWWGTFEIKNECSKTATPNAILPEIRGEESILITIHELVHIACINKNNIELYKRAFTNPLITEEEMEDLAVFYELLYKKLYNFKTDIHILPNSLNLLCRYKNEKLSHQIIKLKDINKK